MINRLPCFAASVATLALFSAAFGATIEITDTVAHSLPEEIFGQFLERPSWGGEQGPESLADAEGRLPKAIERHLAGMRTKLVRFPFGTDGDYVDWQDLIDLPGRAERPVTTGYRGDKITNRFGFQEYFALAGRMGWSTILVTNLRDALYEKKTVQAAASHAAALVRYAKDSPVPVKIAAVQVGNEGWFFWPPKPEEREALGLASLEECAARLREALVAYADAIQAVDADVSLIADAPRLDDGGGLANDGGAVWRMAIDHDDVRSRYRLLAAHAYSPMGMSRVERDGEKLEPDALSDEELWHGLVATPGRFDAQGENVADAAIYRQIKAMGFKAAVTEWNWNGWGFRKKFPNSTLPKSKQLIAPALGAAGFLQGLMRQENVALATQSMMLGTSWGIASVFVAADGKVRYQPQGEVLRLHAAHHGSQVLESRKSGISMVNSPVRFARWWPQAEKLALIDAVVTGDEHAWYVHWIHRAFAESDELAIVLPASAAETGTAIQHMLTPPDSGNLELQHTSGKIAWRERRITVQLPPASLGVVVVPKPRESYVARVKPDILKWLESVRFQETGWGRWKYTTAMPRDFGLLSSCYVIFVLDELGELNGVPAAEKQMAVEFLKSCRDLVTGYMIDPLVKESDHLGKGHSWEHIHAHMNNGAVSALELLGEDVGALEKPAKAPFHDLSQGGNVEWLLAQPWENPWLIGEHLTKAIKWYWDRLPEARRTADEPVVKELLEALEEHVIDPKTGMPTLRGCKSNQVAMAGAFKIYGGYLAVGRPIPHREQAVDFVLALQRADGSFGDGPVEKAQPLTIQWDSMWVLRELNKSLENGHRFDDIRAAGNRCAEYLLANHRKPDGGFSFDRDHCQAIHNSVRVSPKLPISDTTGTMMSLRCLAYADEWNASSGK